jgi:NAD(P) transhydrogenase subunit alpha
LRVRKPPVEEIALLKANSIHASLLDPFNEKELVQKFAERGVSAISMEFIPRTTRAQKMDVLSSQANLGGYEAVILASRYSNKIFPMMTTAAGTILPSKVFIIGVGVAGLQAIATARRLGANVVATDVRPEVKEQIESVGAKYVGIELKESAAAGGGYAKELSEDDRRRQAELLAAECAQSDVVITTALIGGVFAPRLISADTVKTMKPGSVIVDLGADGGGNCELSKPGETVQVGGVTIIAPLNLPSTVPYHASLLFSRNLTGFLSAFTRDRAFQLDFNDDIQQGAVITHGGDVKNARTREALEKENL